MSTQLIPTPDPLANKKIACATYIEQIKLLVTLASAFVLAPAGFVALLKDASGTGTTQISWTLLILSEGLFVASVLSGYLSLGAITGSQNDGSFDVFRPAARTFSLVQLATYLFGVVAFVVFVARTPRVTTLPVAPDPTARAISELQLYLLRVDSANRTTNAGARAVPPPKQSGH